MSDRWDFYLHEIGEERASTFLDLGIRDRVPDRKRPILLRVRLQMQVPRDDGLSGSEEYAILRQLEGKFTAKLQRSLKAQYVGRTTASGYREFCFYSPKTAERSDIVKALEAFPEYNFDFYSTEDCDWRHYLDVLYPSAEEFQTIKNQRVLEVLGEHGDDLTEERPVTHWSFFRTAADREAFLAEVLPLGFSIHDLHENGPGDTRFVACLEREDHVDYESINNVILDLFRLTENHHGIYDGWETYVAGKSEGPGREEVEE